MASLLAPMKSIHRTPSIAAAAIRDSYRWPTEPKSYLTLGSTLLRSQPISLSPLRQQFGRNSSHDGNSLEIHKVVRLGTDAFNFAALVVVYSPPFWFFEVAHAQQIPNGGEIAGFLLPSAENTHTFAGNAGQEGIISVAGPVQSGYDYDVFNPDGSFNEDGSGEQFLRLPQTGTYTVRIRTRQASPERPLSNVPSARRRERARRNPERQLQNAKHRRRRRNRQFHI